MAYIVSGTHQPMIGKTFDNVRSKMVEIQKDIKQAEERTKETKMATKEENVRERIAVDKQRWMRDRMQEVDNMIDKVQIKMQYTKEREFVASRRYQENVKLCETLKFNRVGVPSFDEKMSNMLSRASHLISEMTELNRKIDDKKAKILRAEKRRLKAGDRTAHFEEMLRTKDQIGRRLTTNYTPKTDDEYEEEISELRGRLFRVIHKVKLKESQQQALEKRETETEAQIDRMKKKLLDLRQTENELKGSRI